MKIKNINFDITGYWEDLDMNIIIPPYSGISLWDFKFSQADIFNMDLTMHLRINSIFSLGRKGTRCEFGNLIMNLDCLYNKKNGVKFIDGDDILRIDIADAKHCSAINEFNIEKTNHSKTEERSCIDDYYSEQFSLNGIGYELMMQCILESISGISNIFKNTDVGDLGLVEEKFGNLEHFYLSMKTLKSYE